MRFLQTLNRKELAFCGVMLIFTMFAVVLFAFSSLRGKETNMEDGKMREAVAELMRIQQADKIRLANLAIERVKLKARLRKVEIEHHNLIEKLTVGLPTGSDMDSE